MTQLIWGHHLPLPSVKKNLLFLLIIHNLLQQKICTDLRLENPQFPICCHTLPILYIIYLHQNYCTLGTAVSSTYIQSCPDIHDKFRKLRSSPISIERPVKQKTLWPKYKRLLTSQSPLLVSCKRPVILQFCAKFQDLLTAQSRLCHQTICHKVHEIIPALWPVMPPALQCPVWHRIIVFVLVDYWQMLI
jgi:hypothetical protein